MAAHVTLQDRIKRLTEDDKNTLRELRHTCGEYPYSDESADKLVRMGLAYWIGGTAFLTETGKRVLSIIGQTDTDKLNRLKQNLQDSLAKIGVYREKEQIAITHLEESLTARESYDRETRGTFDAEGRVRS